MYYKLGQKVKYQRMITKKKFSAYLALKDFSDCVEREITRREFVGLDKERIGYIMGRRNVVFNTTFTIDDNVDPDLPDHIGVGMQDKRLVYVVAYNMGKTDYVMEGDLKLIKYAYDDPTLK